MVDGYGNWYCWWRKTLQLIFTVVAEKKCTALVFIEAFQEKQGGSNRYIEVSGRGSLSFFPHLQQNLAGGHSQVLLSAGIIHIAMMPIVKTITRIAMAIQPNKSIGIPFNIKKMSSCVTARNRRINISRRSAKANTKKFLFDCIDPGFSRSASNKRVSTGKSGVPSGIHHSDITQSLGIKRAATQPTVDLRLR
jgi:hypothetical protein